MYRFILVQSKEYIHLSLWFGSDVKVNSYNEIITDSSMVLVGKYVLHLQMRCIKLLLVYKIMYFTHQASATIIFSSLLRFNPRLSYPEAKHSASLYIRSI